MSMRKIILAIGLSSFGLSAFGDVGHNNQSDTKNTSGQMHDNMGNMDMENMDMPHWSSPQSELNRKNPVKMSKNSVKAGENLFRSYCANCHGKNGEGDGKAGQYLSTPPANLREMAGSHPDGDFAYKIKIGRGAMPGWGNTLSDRQVWHLVNFIKSMDSKPVSTNKKKSDHGHLPGEGHDS